MIPRRQGREWALQALVQCELNPPPPEMPAAVWLDSALADFWSLAQAFEKEKKEAYPDYRVRKPNDEMREFTEERVRGVIAERDTLDRMLEPFLEHWPLYRLGTIERNVLRLGAWELLNCGDIPVPIVINEAVDLAKFFSETKSGRFINAVLDNFAKKMPAPGEAPPEGGSAP